MTTQELLDSLIAVHDDGVYLTDVQYIDWSTPAEGGGRRLEISGEDGVVTALDLSPAALLQLHAALTATLLADAR